MNEEEQLAAAMEPIRVYVVGSDPEAPTPAPKAYRERVAAPSGFVFAAGDDAVMIAGHSPNRVLLTITCSGGAALLCQSRSDAQQRKGAKITDTMVLPLTTTSELWAIGFDAAATPTIGVIPEYDNAC